MRVPYSKKNARPPAPNSVIPIKALPAFQAMEFGRRAPPCMDSFSALLISVVPGGMRKVCAVGLICFLML